MKDRATHQLREILPQYRKTRSPKVLVYSTATIKPTRRPEDWLDIPGLGLCVVGCCAKWLPAAYQFWGFSIEHNFDCLQELIDEADEIVSFNGLEFGDRLLMHAGIRVETTFDLMQQVRKAAGQPLKGVCRAGYNLTLLAAENLGGDKDEVRRKSATSPSKVSDLWKNGQTLRVLDCVLNDVLLIGELYDRRRNLRDPVRIGVRLHCDDRLIDWVDVITTIDYLFTERIGSADITLTKHWSGARIYCVRLSLSESLIVYFPIWIKPERRWRDYVGLPFKKPAPGWLASNDPYKQAKTDSELKKDDLDPIPF
jgi:hypothetical protein